MTTLTDRYVWGVLRAVPEAQRPDLEPEIRALIADAMDARVASVAGEAPTAAERAVLTELGDPEVLAARYTDRSLFLIGPAYFLVWKRLLLTILPIIVPHLRDRRDGGEDADRRREHRRRRSAPASRWRST